MLLITLYSIQGGLCNGSSGTQLVCIVPAFTAASSSSETRSNISYTVKFGAAPGPDLTDTMLTLDLRPDPVFAEDGSALERREFPAGEESVLRISVSISHC